MQEQKHPEEADQGLFPQVAVQRLLNNEAFSSSDRPSSIES